jgi:amidohydrolase
MTLRTALSLLMSAWIVAFGARADDQIVGPLDQYVSEIDSAYRYLHENPELGKEETKAHAFLMDRLTQLGFTEFKEVAKLPTAIIAVLDTGKPGPTIALRAEMDARSLPKEVDEPAGHNPRSSIPERMHNCGHDAHAAILLGAAAYLQDHKSEFVGRFVFVFQPAEESAGGADDIVEAGVLRELGVKAMFAQHATPGVPVGVIGVGKGPTLAGSNYFTLNITGRSSHAAAPQDGDDVLLASTHFVQALSYFPARNLDIAARPAIISVTSFAPDSKVSNILPSSVELKGTIRAFEDPTASQNGAPSIEEGLVAEFDGLKKALGVNYQWSLRKAAPPTINNEALYDAIVPSLVVQWPSPVITSPPRGMFSEDFAYYTEDVPSLYFMLGIAKDGLGDAGVHSADFTIHPDALTVGLRLLISVSQISSSTLASGN